MLAERVKEWTQEWKEQGLREGRQEGKQEGRQEGRQEGVHLGEANLLRRLLSRRFGALPPWVEERIAGADNAEIEYWAERLLECANIEDVFGGKH